MNTSLVAEALSFPENHDSTSPEALSFLATDTHFREEALFFPEKGDV